MSCANFPRGDERLSNVLASVSEECGAGGVLEANPIRVFNGDGGVNGDVNVDSEVGYVDREIQASEFYRIDVDDGVLGLEYSEGQS